MRISKKFINKYNFKATIDDSECCDKCKYYGEDKDIYGWFEYCYLNRNEFKYDIEDMETEDMKMTICNIYEKKVGE